MNKQKFACLFYEAVEKAALDAEKFLEQKIPRHVAVEMHGANYAGVITTPDEAIDILFIDSNTFYRIIDFVVTSVTEDQTTVHDFCRDIILFLTAPLQTNTQYSKIRGKRLNPAIYDAGGMKLCFPWLNFHEWLITMHHISVRFFSRCVHPVQTVHQWSNCF